MSRASASGPGPGGAHAQLKLHSIVPVILPPRYARARDPLGAHRGHRGEIHANGNGVPPRPPEGSHRNRSDSFVVTSSSIFSSPIKQATSGGSIPVHRPAKRVTEKDRPHRDTRRPVRADPISFDPFCDTPYYAWLTQDPNSSMAAQQFRRDPSNLRVFREWITTQFPTVVTAFKSLRMLHDRPPPVTIATHPDHRSVVHERGETVKEMDDSDSDDHDAEFDAELEPKALDEPQRSTRQRLLLHQREAQQLAWSVLFESARLLSVPPGDVFVTQDESPARDVFFVLSGECQLLFQPKFLDSVVQMRNEHKANHTHSRSGTEDSAPASQRSHASREGTTALDPVDFQSSLDALLAMRRLSLSTLTAAEATEAIAHAMYPLRVLVCGDYFGLEACAFRFAHHSVSALSQGAMHRNAIGVATPACLHVLVVPFQALEHMRSLISTSRAVATTGPPQTTPQPTSERPDDAVLAPRRRGQVKRSMQDAMQSPKKPIGDALPGCEFRDDDVEFLRHTFLLQSIQAKRLHFLATQVRLLRVPKHEYLFTTGQDVVVYVVKSGQLRVFSPEKVRIHAAEDDERDTFGSGVALTTVETRHVELEILQVHDMVGLMEASLLQPTFSNYCLATSSDVYVYAIPPVALFTVLAQEPTASHHVVESLLCHHSWYKARKFTALNHHNKQTEFRLSLGAQRKSPIPCSRCGWSGHTSTSSLCVRAASPKSAFIEHLLGKDDARARPAASPPTVHSPSLRSRMDRVSQLRLAHASRTGSVVAPTTEEPSSSAVVGGRAGGMDSLLPGLADLAALLQTTHSHDDAPAHLPDLKSDVVKALDRLDAALDADERMQRPVATVGRSPRPTSQQLQRRRPVESSNLQRGSVFNLRDEAVKVVARIGTAPTATPSPRALLRRRAIDDR